MPDSQTTRRVVWCRRIMGTGFLLGLGGVAALFYFLALVLIGVLGAVISGTPEAYERIKWGRVLIVIITLLTIIGAGNWMMLWAHRREPQPLAKPQEDESL